MLKLNLMNFSMVYHFDTKLFQVQDVHLELHVILIELLRLMLCQLMFE